MNVIFILLDGVRVDRIKRFKNLRELTEGGAFFSNMITYAPSTIASMHAIFSGTYGSENGVNNYWASPRFKKEKYKTLTEYLKDKGYYTRGDSINKLVLPPQGFDKLTIHDEHKDDLVERHRRILGEMEGKGKFFLYLHYSKIHAHTTIEVIKKYKDEYDERYFNNKKENSKKFDEYMKEADDYLGAMIDECKKLDLLQDSLLVVASDHGTGIGEKIGERRYGFFCYDYTLKVFTIFWNQNIFPQREVTEMVRTIDIAPTLLEVLNIKEDVKFAPMGGKSLLSLIQGKKEDKKRSAFSETASIDEPGRRKPNLRCIRTQDWKLIYNQRAGRKELYHLKEDPNEENNMINRGLREEKILWNLLRKHIKANLDDHLEGVANLLQEKKQ